MHRNSILNQNSDLTVSPRLAACFLRNRYEHRRPYDRNVRNFVQSQDPSAVIAARAQPILLISDVASTELRPLLTVMRFEKTQPLSIGAQLRAALQLIKPCFGRRGKAGAARRRILNSDFQSEGNTSGVWPKDGDRQGCRRFTLKSELSV